MERVLSFSASAPQR